MNLSNLTSLLVALVMSGGLATTASAGTPAANPVQPTEMTKLKALISTLDYHVGVHVAKMHSDCLKISRERGRCEAWLAELNQRLLLVDLEIQRLVKHSEALKTMSASSSTLDRWQQAIKQTRDYQTRLRQSLKQLQARLAELEKQYLQTVIRHVPPTTLELDEEPLDQAKKRLAQKELTSSPANPKQSRSKLVPPSGSPLLEPYRPPILFDPCPRFLRRR